MSNLFKYTCLDDLFEGVIPFKVFCPIFYLKKLTGPIYNKKLSYNNLSVDLIKHDALCNIHREVSSITLLSTQ